MDVNGEELGTAWLIQPGYVVTNRHVAQFLSIDPGEERLRFAPHRPAVVDFGDGVTSGGRFDVERIIFSGPDYIDRSRVDHRKLDYYSIMNAWKSTIVVLGTAVRCAIGGKSHQDVLLSWIVSFGNITANTLETLLRKEIDHGRP